MKIGDGHIPVSFGMRVGNKNCTVELKGDKVSGTDLNDQNNLPAFYTTKKRNVEKGFLDVVAQFNDDTTMYDVMTILDKHKLCCHSYCMMD